MKTAGGPDRVGIAFLDRPGVTEQLSLVQRAEQLGYASAWVAETRLTRDAISVLGAFAACTTRIPLGAGVINTWTRGPVLTALTFATLHELAPGRVVLGLGAYSDPLAANQGITRTRPVRQMEEYIEVVRALLELDEPVTYHGQVVHVSDVLLDLGAGVPREPIRLPIYIGATGMRMMELAGEIADGVLLNGFMSSEYTTKAIERIHVGATRAGRDPATIDTPQLVDVAVSPDRDDAYEKARWMVAMYLGGQPHIAKAAGIDPDLADRLRDTVAGWPPDPRNVTAATHLIDRRIVDDLVVHGTATDCRGRLRERAASSSAYPVISPLTDNVAEIIEVCAPAG
jgi:5,10-methylenetetrahydromethanopterin reductase